MILDVLRALCLLTLLHLRIEPVNDFLVEVFPRIEEFIIRAAVLIRGEALEALYGRNHFCICRRALALHLQRCVVKTGFA